MLFQLPAAPLIIKESGLKNKIALKNAVVRVLTRYQARLYETNSPLDFPKGLEWGYGSRTWLRSVRVPNYEVERG